MIRIRRIADDASPADRAAIEAAVRLLREAFPAARAGEFESLPVLLRRGGPDQVRAFLLVAENGMGRVRGAAILWHMPDVRVLWLDYIAGATVSVEYLAGSVTGLTGGGSEPSSRLQQGSVQFRLPGEYPWVHVTVTADGYCPYEEDIYLGGRPHVGGQGIWVAMEACQAASVGAAIAH